MELTDGVYTVLVTPFTEKGKVDYDDLGKLVEKACLDSTVGIVILGTTSESPTLHNDDKDSIVKFVSRLNNKRKILIVGIGGNNTADVMNFGKFCSYYADGLMVTVPNYNKPPQEGIEEHFVSIANSEGCKDKPILMYNVPSRTGINMLPETMLNIVRRCANVVGVKEASGDLNQVKNVLELFKDNNNFKVFSGNDSDVVPICKMGGRGVISVASNIVPNVVCELCTLCLENKYQKAEKMADKCKDFFETLFITSNPIPVKELMFQLEMIKSNKVLLPLISMRDNNMKETLFESYKNLIS